MAANLLAQAQHTSTSSPTSGRDPIADGVSLIVRNLPDDFTKMELQQMFGGFGRILKVHISSSPTRCGKHMYADKYAFVHFEDPAQAKAAMEHLDGKLKLDGAPLKLFIRPARADDGLAMGLVPQQHSRLHFSGFLAADVTIGKVATVFGRFGRVCHIRMASEGGRATVAGTADMESPEAVAAAIAALDGSTHGTGLLRVRWAAMNMAHASHKQPTKFKADESRSSAWDTCRVYYSCIPSTESPAAIAEVFGRFGEVLYVAPTPTTRPLLSRVAADGNGVVVMASEQSAKEAVAGLNGSFTWPGAERPLKVKPWVNFAAGSSSSSSSYSSYSHSSGNSYSSRRSNPASPDGKEPNVQEGVSAQSNPHLTYQDHSPQCNPVLPQQGHLPHPAMLSTAQYQVQAPSLSDPGNSPFAWVVDATGRQQPVYCLADGRLLMVTGGAAPVLPPAPPRAPQLWLPPASPAPEQYMQQHSQLSSPLLLSRGAVSAGTMQPSPLHPLLPPGLHTEQQQQQQQQLAPGLYQQQQLYQGEPSQQQPTLLFQKLPTGQLQVAPSGSLALQAPLHMAATGCWAPQLAAAGHPMQGTLLTDTPALLGPTGPAEQLGMAAGFSALPAVGASCMDQMLAAQGLVPLQGGSGSLVAGIAG